MHKGLYPHLYDGDGKPKQPIEEYRPAVRKTPGVALKYTAGMLLRRQREEKFYQFYRQKLRGMYFFPLTLYVGAVLSTGLRIISKEVREEHLC
jgi:hypothetical protein